MSADTTYVHATFAVAGTPSPILTLTKLELCLQSTSAIVSAGDYSVAPGHECARVHAAGDRRQAVRHEDGYPTRE